MKDYEHLQTRKDLVDIDVKINHQSNDWKMLWEWHEQVEMMYVISGTGTCYIEEQVYTFNEDDLFIIGPHKLHKTELIKSHDFKVLIVIFNMKLQEFFPAVDHFDVLQFIKLNEVDFSPHLVLKKSNKSRLLSILKRMLEEYKREEGYSLGYLISLLHMLLIEINRMYRDVGRSKNNVLGGVRMPRSIVDIIGYMNQHFVEDIHLSNIADIHGLNPSYLSRQFKKTTGMTITEYITIRRIEFAKNLLTKTDKNITEISFEVGYNNTPYFNSVFKKIVGVNPKKFRNSAMISTRKLE